MPQFLLVLFSFSYMFNIYFKQILYPTLCCIIGVDVKVVIIVIIVVIVVIVVVVGVVVTLPGGQLWNQCKRRHQ